MKQYKAVFLDWDDTIGDFHGAAVRSLQDIYQKYRLDRFFFTFETYYDTYHPHNIELWERYGRSEVTKDYLQHDRFAYPLFRSVAKEQLGSERIETMADEIGDDFVRLTTEYFSVLPYAAETVRYLARKYPLTIVSNGFVEVQYDKIRRSGLQDCFRYVVLSEEVGVQKPDPAIFERALQLNRLTADEVVMVGDSFMSDIQGAINAGIDQIWIQQNDIDDNRPSTYKISSIRQLTDLL